MRCLMALIRKECLQIIRDPSSLLIAFVLPCILLFIFGYGVNLDSSRLRIGVVLESTNVDSLNLASAFSHSRFFDVRLVRDRREVVDDLIAGHLRGIVVIPQQFTLATASSGNQAQVQLITDGSEPNVANFLQAYTAGVMQVWLSYYYEDKGQTAPSLIFTVAPRFWYNPELLSRRALLPGSIAIIMTLIGTLLTALVIAREWERGTIEALMATPVSITQILLGKLVPYFILGMASMILCWLAVTLFFDVPFRGSFWALCLVSAVFLFAALGQGLLISTLSKNQFIASQVALVSGFLPSFMLSGFIFEIASMPLPIQGLTYLVAARYFVTALQGLFLTGSIWPTLISCMASMLTLAAVLFFITLRKTTKRLDV